MAYCPNCGRETSADVTLCPYCGASLTALPPPPPPVVIEVPISYVVQTATISFDEKASRFELLVRILWLFLAGLVGFVYSLVFGIIILIYGVIASILNTLNFFIILIAGKHWKTAFDWQLKLITKSAIYYARLYNYWMRRAPYFGLMTDKRPDLEMEPEPSRATGGSPA